LPAENGKRVRNPGQEIRTRPDRREQVHRRSPYRPSTENRQIPRLHLAGASQLWKRPSPQSTQEQEKFSRNTSKLTSRIRTRKMSGASVSPCGERASASSCFR